MTSKSNSLDLNPLTFGFGHEQRRRWQDLYLDTGNWGSPWRSLNALKNIEADFAPSVIMIKRSRMRVVLTRLVSEGGRQSFGTMTLRRTLQKKRINGGKLVLWNRFSATVFKLAMQFTVPQPTRPCTVLEDFEHQLISNLGLKGVITT